MGTLARDRWLRGPKLEAVLYRLAERLGGSLNRTQVVKLPYLVDVIAVGTLGQPVTESRYEAWKLGVVAPGAWAVMENDLGGQYFSVPTDPSDSYLRAKEIRPPAALLSAKEKAIVDFVAEEYRGVWAADLGDITKSLNPEVALEEWGTNKEIEPSEDAYSRLSPEFQEFWKGIASLDLADPSGWEDPGDDVEDYLRRRMATAVADA